MNASSYILDGVLNAPVVCGILLSLWLTKRVKNTFTLRICRNFFNFSWQDNQVPISVINLYVQMGMILYWSHDLFSSFCNGRFSNAHTVPFDWFNLLFFNCLRLCNLRRQNWWNVLFILSYLTLNTVTESFLTRKEFTFHWKFF